MLSVGASQCFCLIKRPLVQSFKWSHFINKAHLIKGGGCWWQIMSGDKKSILTAYTDFSREPIRQDVKWARHQTLKCASCSSWWVNYYVLTLHDGFWSVLNRNFLARATFWSQYNGKLKCMCLGILKVRTRRMKRRRVKISFPLFSFTQTLTLGDES